MFKPPRVIRQLAQHGIEALKPNLSSGRYQGPMVSPRRAAVVRKRAIIEGTYGTFCPYFGGWLPEWDKPRKMDFIRVPKGHKRERTREARAEKITQAMKEMPKKIQAYKDDLNKRKPDRGPLWRFRLHPVITAEEIRENERQKNRMERKRSGKKK